MPVPLLSIYSATKAYIDSISRALHEEYKDKGIVIQNSLSTYWLPNKEQSVRNALLAIGSQSRACDPLVVALKTYSSMKKNNCYLKRHILYEELRDRIYTPINS
ncbi:unnamed protein product [Oppiella nova]|uniref:Uncharacterized protein n=1 Tax=Oppiella nova TaxID=334625 RepID=A0A7R9M612_9ACAR|nr:unnamed protein product [Oppiella nova]CAG2171153.1 unnamed protein product [Oppiella nova]